MSAAEEEMEDEEEGSAEGSAAFEGEAGDGAELLGAEVMSQSPEEEAEAAVGGAGSCGRDGGGGWN